MSWQNQQLNKPFLTFIDFMKQLHIDPKTFALTLHCIGICEN
jgi:hypothetical protein